MSEGVERTQRDGTIARLRQAGDVLPGEPDTSHTFIKPANPRGEMPHSLCKEEFSKAYVAAVASAAGCSVAGAGPDYQKNDVTIRQSANHLIYDECEVNVQAKCTSQEVMREDGVHFPVDYSTYEGLRSSKVYTCKILVVMVLPSDNPEEWVDHSTERLEIRNCAYWISLRGYHKIDTGKKTVILPKSQQFNVPGLLGILRRIGDGGVP